MPFTGPGDPNLPSNVKPLAVEVRRQWVAVFNSALARCLAGDGTEAECEASAFRQANGVIKERGSMPETVTIRNVELMTTGTFHGQGCPPKGCVMTTEIIDEMVTAHTATVGKLDPPIKLGHNKKQELLGEDGLPAAGWVTNLRRAGEKLLGDFERVPRKIADLIASGGFRKRSVEIRPNMEIGGKRFPHVLTAVALLGEVLPAVEGLDDIAKLYGSLDLEVEDDTQIILYAGTQGDGDTVESIIGEIDRLQARAEALIKNKKGAPVLRELQRAYVGGLRRAGKGEALASLKQRARETGNEEERKTLLAEAQAIEEELMALDEKALRDVLGIDADADLMETVKGLKASNSESEYEAKVLGPIRKALGLADDADVLEAVAALKGKVKDPESEAVTAKLRTDLDTAQTQILEMQKRDHDREVEALVDGAIQEGRLLPKQKGTALSMARRNIEEFKAFVETQPSLIELGERGTSADTDTLQAELAPTAMQIDIAQQSGIEMDEEWRFGIMRENAAAKNITLPDDFGPKPKEKEQD